MSKINNENDLFDNLVMPNDFLEKIKTFEEKIPSILDDFKKYPIAYKLAHQAVSLPIYPSLLKSDAKKIANIAKPFR